jgi:toxin ParE1/3/4
VEEYIEKDNPPAAINTVLRVLDAIETLLEYPNIGRAGRVPSTRELVVNQTPFIVIYKVANNIIWVLRVLHGSQRWP